MTDPSAPLLWLATIALILGAVFVRPHRARCPAGWWLDTGVRSSGSFACWSPAAPQCVDAKPGVAADDCYAGRPDPVHVESAIYCTSGQEPIVVDGQSVGCMRGGWR